MIHPPTVHTAQPLRTRERGDTSSSSSPCPAKNEFTLPPFSSSSFRHGRQLSCRGGFFCLSLPSNLAFLRFPSSRNKRSLSLPARSPSEREKKNKPHSPRHRLFPSSKDSLFRSRKCRPPRLSSAFPLSLSLLELSPSSHLCLLLLPHPPFPVLLFPVSYKTLPRCPPPSLPTEEEGGERNRQRG